ncbi:MAG: hypothetical protein WC530_05745 [Candidatus Omnitrophota bacterium]
MFSVLNFLKKKDSSTVFVGDMWAYFNLDNPGRRYQAFVQNGHQRFSKFIDSLLLYDKAIIPTQDYVSLTALVGVLGEKTVIDLLESGDIKFARLKGAFGYIGNGGGIQSFVISKDEKHGLKLQPFGDETDAVPWALEILSPKPREIKLITKLVTKNVQTIEATTIAESIRHETYTDILNSPYLRNRFAIRNTHMDRLQGINPNQVRMCGGPDSPNTLGDEIDIVMEICSSNLELNLAQRTGCKDLSTTFKTGHFLKGKAERAPNLKSVSSFLRLVEVGGVPDPSSYLLKLSQGDRQKRLAQLLKLKRSGKGKKFREWFHGNHDQNPDVIVQKYIEALGKIPWISSVPAKIMRFILTGGVGLAIAGPTGAAVGMAVGAADSFFLDDWLKGFSPKIFIDDLRQVFKES